MNLVWLCCRIILCQWYFIENVCLLLFLPFQFDTLELDKLEKALYPCPLLLDPNSYLPDTVDLTKDTAAREYWLDCFSKSVDKAE